MPSTRFPNISVPVEKAVSELDTAYLNFRLALSTVLRCRGVEPNSGTSIANGLGITRQLAWQIANVASEPVSADGLLVLPGQRGLALFLKACDDHNGNGAGRETTELRSATARLESAITEHAGDRAGLNLMTAAWGAAGLEDRSERLRRDSFKAQSALLGLQTPMQVRGMIFAPSPSDDPNKLSFASYSYFKRLVRLRADRSCRLFYSEVPWHDDGSPGIEASKMTEHVEQMYRLSPDHSTVSGDHVEITVRGTRAWVTLRPGAIGHSSAVNLAFTGHSNFEHTKYRTRKDAYNQIATFCFVPTEKCFIDVLMPRHIAETVGLFANSEVLCYDASTGLPMIPAGRQDPAFLYDLGPARPISIAELALEPGVPELFNLVDNAAASLGTNSQDLVGIRFSSKYVLAATTLMFSRTLVDPA